MPVAPREPFVLAQGDIPSVAWPPVHSTRTASLAALIHQLEQTQWLSAEEIAAGQRRQLGAIAGFFAANHTWFAERLTAAGLTPADLGQPGGLQRLPILTRREAQANFAPAPRHALPAGHGGSSKFNTSGSTGEPVIVWKTELNLLDWSAVTMRYYRWGKSDFSGKLAAIRALPHRVGESENWGTPISQFYKTGPLLAIDIGTDLDRQIEMLAAFAPQSVIIYPSNLDALTIRLEDRGETLPSIKRFWTLGETLYPSTRERTREFWNLDIYDAYSSEEVGYVAIQCPESGLYHTMDEMLVVEVVDEDGRICAPGESGRVVVTDLRNHATPMFRYQMGDHAIAAGPCPCGRGLATIERILGRERNMIRNPDGTRHWPLTGYKKYREIAPITQYQMVQTALDRIELRLVAERKVTKAEQNELRHYLQKALKHPFTIDFSFHEGRLPAGPNGKFEEFVSMIGD